MKTSINKYFLHLRPVYLSTERGIPSGSDNVYAKKHESLDVSQALLDLPSFSSNQFFTHRISYSDGQYMVKQTRPSHTRGIQYVNTQRCSHSTSLGTIATRSKLVGEPPSYLAGRVSISVHSRGRRNLQIQAA